MKRIFSILLTLTLLAGLTAIPTFASTDTETGVYYENDFTNANSDNRYYVTNGSIVDGTLSYYRGGGVIFTDENTTRKSDALGVKIYESVEDKPDIQVEYSITLPSYASTFKNNERYITSNFDDYYYGIDTLDISIKDIWPGKKAAKEHYTNGTDIALLTLSEGNNCGKTYNVKILYSATKDIKTIYINDVCMGTYNLKTDYYSWAQDTSGYFKLGFTFAGTNTASWNVIDREVKLDNVKISKLDENMIYADVEFDESANILPVDHYSKLWIPEGEQAKLTVRPSDGKTISVSVNDDIYIDSFSSEFEYKTPAALEDGDEISITQKAVVTTPSETTSAVTKPYVFQYKKEDGSTAVVLLGKYDVIDGYTVSSKGMFISKSNPDVTVAEGEDYKLCSINKSYDNLIKDGNFAIELTNSNWKPGDVIYYKTYVNYKQGDDYSLRVYGEPLSYTIRDDE